MKARFEGEGDEDMKAKAKFGYYKMDDKKKAMFDKKMKEKQGRREDGDKQFYAKMEAAKKAAGWDKMTAEKKDAFMERAMAKYKDTWERKEKYGK